MVETNKLSMNSSKSVRDISSESINESSRNISSNTILHPLLGTKSEIIDIPNNELITKSKISINNDKDSYVINRYLLPKRMKCGKKVIVESASEVDFRDRYSKQSLALLSFKKSQMQLLSGVNFTLLLI